MPHQHARPSADLGAEVARLQALLGRQDFRCENLALLREAYLTIARLGAKPGSEWDTFLKDRVLPFAQKWNAWPAMDWGLFAPDRWHVGAILTGQWGVVPVFPWTTDARLLSAARLVRRRIGKHHRDAMTHRRALLARWLETNDIPRREIPRLIRWREGGAERPTTAEVLEHVSPARQKEMINRLMKQGWSEREARREMRRALRGTEAPAARTVRLAYTRYDTWRRAFEAALSEPPTADPLSATLSRMVRARWLRPDDAAQTLELKRAVDRLCEVLLPRARS
jgi:hypothetical protein